MMDGDREGLFDGREVLRWLSNTISLPGLY